MYETCRQQQQGWLNGAARPSHIGRQQDIYTKCWKVSNVPSGLGIKRYRECVQDVPWPGPWKPNSKFQKPLQMSMTWLKLQTNNRK